MNKFLYKVQEFFGDLYPYVLISFGLLVGSLLTAAVYG